MTTLIARFSVNGWDERTIDGLDGGWMGAVEMRKHYTAGLSDPATWFGHVVPHSGTDDFADWSGSARIGHDAEGAFVTFDLA